MKIKTLAGCVITSALVAGCSTQPSAFYQPIPTQSATYQGDWAGLSKFTLAKSELVFNQVGEDEKDGKSTKKKIVVTSIPSEAKHSNSQPTRFAMTPDDPFGVTTQMSITKVDNTELISSIGTEVEDHRVKYIEGAGAIVVGLLGIAWSGDKGTKEFQPISIDTYELLTSLKVGRGEGGGQASAVKKSGTQQAVDFTVSFGPVPDDAIDTKVFAAKASDEAQETIFYSACRSIKVHFKDGVLAGQTFSEVIADPRYVQTVKIPEKGKVSFHSSCGVSTSTESSGASDATDIGKALVSQTKSIRDAWKASADAETKTE